MSPALRLRGAHAVVQQLPQRLVAHAPLVELDAVDQQALGVEVDEVDVEARRGGADVDQVRGGGGESEQAPFVENGQRHAHVGGVRCPVVRVVVKDDVAVVDVALQRAHEPADVERQGADVHGRALALAQLAPGRVEQPAAEVLGLADDAGVGHAVEHLRHLAGDRVERPADHPQGDHVDAGPVDGLRRENGRGGRRRGFSHGRPPRVRVRRPASRLQSCSSSEGAEPRACRLATEIDATRLPWRSTSARAPGGMTVVASSWLTTAGPSIRFPASRRVRS